MANVCVQGRGPGLYDEQLQRQQQEKMLRTSSSRPKSIFFADADDTRTTPGRTQ